MNPKMNRGNNWRRRLVASGILAMGLLWEPRVRAQAQPDANPTFEVASIVPQKGYPNGYHHPVFVNGRFTATAPLRQLIAFAYHVPLNPGVRLSGGPDWIRGSEGFYDIQAKGSLPDDLNSDGRDEWGRLMLRALLADRFKLAIHRETKEMQVYILVVDKGGPKLENSDIAEKDCFQSAKDGQIPCHQVWGSPGRGLRARAITTADLASYVENWTDRPLLDETGILGLFKLETQPFLPMELGATDPGDLPSQFQVFERLGLKLKVQRDRAETYVIDSIQKPTDN
jgi:uncharacterized protein (TIGR03435 family)